MLNLRDLVPELKALSTKQSKILHNNLVQFTNTKANVQGNQATVGDAEASKFLTEQVYYLLKNVYKAVGVPESYDEFEDLVTLSDIIAFLQAQIDKNGPTDFLTRPYASIISSLEKIFTATDQAIQREIDKI